MATVSVKLPETTKSKLQKQAKAQGVTAHALMVAAIETALDKSDQKTGFIQQAIHAKKKTLKTGQAFEGAELSSYLKAKVRGEKTKRPAAVKLTSLKLAQA